jgi:putative transposase
MHKAFEYRIYPTKQQQELINQTLGCCRKVYNTILAQASTSYSTYKASLDTTNPILKPEFPSGYTLANRLPALKQEFPYLQEVSNVALQQTILDLGTSFSNFLKGKAKYPKFKKYGTKNSFQLTTNGFRFDQGNLYIAKSKKPLNVRWSRKLSSPPTSLTITKKPSGNYFISFLCDVTDYRQVAYQTQTVGIDLGLTDYAILSTGRRIANPRNLKKYEKRLANLQMHGARKHKGSNNRKKLNLKVAKQHERISNLRKNFIEQETTRIVRDHQFISIEGLKVANMIKNHKLAKSISDASWGIFVTRLFQKVAETQNSILVTADTYYPSSKLCSCCGHKLPSLTLSTREWICPICSTEHDRDLNAAFNLESILDSNLEYLTMMASSGPKFIVANAAGTLH